MWAFAGQGPASAWAGMALWLCAAASGRVPACLALRHARRCPPPPALTHGARHVQHNHQVQGGALEGRGLDACRGVGPGWAGRWKGGAAQLPRCRRDGTRADCMRCSARMLAACGVWVRLIRVLPRASPESRPTAMKKSVLLAASSSGSGATPSEYWGQNSWSQRGRPGLEVSQEYSFTMPCREEKEEGEARMGNGALIEQGFRGLPGEPSRHPCAPLDRPAGSARAGPGHAASRPQALASPRK